MEQNLENYKQYLKEEEKSKNTTEKYIRDVKKFLDYTGGRQTNKNLVLDFKEELIKKYEPTSVNSILAAVNNFLEWMGMVGFKVKPLVIQKDLYSKPEKELSLQEYQKLVRTAEQKGKRKLSLIIQTICSTGIRVSELKFITVESVKQGRATVNCKGKNRIIFLPKNLCKKLKEYCKTQNILSGIIFLSKNAKAIDRTSIWKQMKKICKDAGVAEGKVFPHNLRHLFARTYYKIYKDISRLADILGHSSINTTRIYTIETGKTHIKQLEKLNLIYT